MITQIPILSLLIWLPLIGGLLVLFGPGDKLLVWSQRIALVVSSVILVLVGILLYSFDGSSGQLELTESAAWVSSLNIKYSLGVDGISVPLIALTGLINLLVVIGAIGSI